MKVRVLGCSGAIAKDCRTTSFLLDHDLLVDAGTGVGDLTLDEIAAIDHVLLTHSHLDHIAALPLMVDAMAATRSKPVQVHALQATIDALKAHVFNNIIWPDFFQKYPRRRPPSSVFMHSRRARPWSWPANRSKCCPPCMPCRRWDMP